MEINKKDRIILINQYKILAALNPGESSHYEELIEILERGYSVFYSMIDEWVSEDMPVEKSRIVFDILGIYRAIEDFKRRFQSQAVEETHRSHFPGFDGNNEAEYLGFTRFLIETQGKFAEQKQYLNKNDNLNSHFPMVDTYKRMISAWKGMGSPFILNEQQAVSILKV